MNRAVSRPTGKWFRLHLLYVLGQLCESEPFTGADPDLTTTKVLELAGIDPDDPPWPVETRADDPRRLIGFTFRNLRPGYKKYNFLTMELDDGTWALSVLGCAKAKEIDPDRLPKYKPQKSVTEVLSNAQAKAGVSSVYEKVTDLTLENVSTLVSVAAQAPPPTPVSTAIKVVEPRRVPKDCNLTAQYLREHGRELYARLSKYLSRKFTTSREQGLIEDHIQTFFAAFINADKLGPRLERGEKVPLGQVCVFARKNVISQIRDNARRPLHRIMQGARTEKERKDAKDALKANPDIESWSQRVFVRQGDYMKSSWNAEDETWTNPMEALSDDSTIQILDEKLAFDEGFSSFQKALRRRAPSQADEFADILQDRFVMEMTVKECAEKRGITRNQAASMLRTARNIIAREYERGTLRKELGC